MSGIAAGGAGRIQETPRDVYSVCRVDERRQCEVRCGGKLEAREAQNLLLAWAYACASIFNVEEKSRA